MSGIYIHIPFCKQACSYCDFYFVTRHHQHQHFVDALVQEIQSKKDTRYSAEKIQTVYLGGGTPSLLTPAQLDQIFVALDTSFSLEVSECTMELNPDDVTKDYLQAIKAIGISRASMGIQTFDEQLLKFMHRAHNRGEALHCLELLASQGFESFTVDLIYGNPNQTEEMLNKDLEILCSFHPPHVSAYSLTIEEGTRLGKQVALGRIAPPEDDSVARHFEKVQTRLAEHGIAQYEVSNFSKPGWEAKHNSAYWSHQNYLGLGPASHSFWWDEAAKKAQRWTNKRDLNAYLKGDWKSKTDLDEIDKESLAEERLMLGLRTKKGLKTQEMQEKYEFRLSKKQTAYLEKKVQEGLVLFDGDSLSLTNQGLLIADMIVLDLITA